MKNYYIYVYIDPRNFEEFYYGKGKGSRKASQLFSNKDSDRSKRIKDIRRAGLEPIIRIIATDLSEDEAYLVETTLIWKLGKFTTNIASGHFARKFRPLNTLHLELNGFDYENGLYYYNIGEGKHRNWDDYRKYGFISAGQGKKWGDAMKGFEKGDVVVAYLKNHGFAGIGSVIQKAKMIRDVTINGKRLLDLPLKCKNMNDNQNSPDKSEYAVLVDWIKAFPRNKAKWESKSGLYTTQLIRASLDGQPKTIEFIEKEFGLSLKDLIK